MPKKDRMSGNEAVAFAIKQINPDVMPAFPITPSTEIPQMVSNQTMVNEEVITLYHRYINGGGNSRKMVKLIRAQGGCLGTKSR